MKITDHLNRTIELKTKPQRVVSLVPSITETLAGLGLEKNLIAVTRFCKYPPDVVEQLPKIGGPKKINLEKIVALKPDLVIAVKEENDREQVLKLSEQIPVVVFDVNTIEDSFDMLNLLGQLFGVEQIANRWVNSIMKKTTDIKTSVSNHKALYLIWKKPWMAAGTDTFIGSMMRLAGFNNIVNGRYPEISRQEFDKAQIILLATEPYHFTETHQKQLANEFPDKKVVVVDGEMFTWYGTHMLKALDYLKQIKSYW